MIKKDRLEVYRDENTRYYVYILATIAGQALAKYWNTEKNIVNLKCKKEDRYAFALIH